MSLPVSGQISLGQMRTEIGGAGEISLSDLYGIDLDVPDSGEISFSKLHDRAHTLINNAASPITYSKSNPFNHDVTLTFIDWDQLSPDGDEGDIEGHNVVTTEVVGTWCTNGHKLARSAPYRYDHKWELISGDAPDFPTGFNLGTWKNSGSSGKSARLSSPTSPGTKSCVLELSLRNNVNGTEILTWSITLTAIRT